MKRAAFLLIFLLIWAQVDDAWALAPVPASASLGDDDEYLPAQRQRLAETSATRQRPVFVVANVSNEDFFSPVFAKNLCHAPCAVPVGPSSLYVFMSLRC